MPKAVITIPGVRYSTSFTQAGTVEAVLTSGTRVLLKAVNEAGQCSYTAISARVEVSDNAAVTVPETNRVVPAEAGCDAGAVEQIVESALASSIENSATPVGTSDENYFYADIPAKYIPSGRLLSLTLKGGQSNTNAYANLAYLVVWQEQSAGTDNFQPVAVSTNAVKLEANKSCEWLFDSPLLLNQRVRFYLADSGTLEAGFNWSNKRTIRSRAILTEHWKDGHVFTPGAYNCLPELVIKVAVGKRFAPPSHSGDTIAHLTAEEHAGLTALLAHKDEILALFPAALTTEFVEEEETNEPSEPMNMDRYRTETSQSNEN